MTISVTFCLNVKSNNCLMEDGLSTQFEDYRSEILANENFLGAIFIKSSDGKEVRVEDELEATVQNLCFRAVADLKAGKNTVINYFSYYGKLQLNYEGTTVLIYGDFVPEVRVLTEELLLSLYECGQRFINFFRNLRGDDPIYKDAITHLEAQAEVTRLALSK